MNSKDSNTKLKSKKNKTVNAESRKINRILAMVLRVGSGLSVILMTLGLALFLAAGGGLSGQEVKGAGFLQVMAEVLNMNPLALMTLGILVLLVTPYLRVFGAFISFTFIEKEMNYALISFGVLLILTVSMVVPGLH